MLVHIVCSCESLNIPATRSRSLIAALPISSKSGNFGTPEVTRKHEIKHVSLFCHIKSFKRSSQTLIAICDFRSFHVLQAYRQLLLSLVSLLCDISKQNSPRCDAAERGVPSGAILFAWRNFIGK